MSSALYISKTSMSFVKTITVFFTFQRPSESFVKTIRVFFTFPRLSESFVKTIIVFFTFPRLSGSFVKTITVFFTFQRPSESFVKTITVFFTFQILQCLLSRLSQSSLHFEDFNVFCQDYQSILYFSKTIKYQSLLSFRDYQCLMPFTFQIPSESFIKTITMCLDEEFKNF